MFEENGREKVVAKIDEIKELIGFLKAIFIMSIVIMSSLIAYLYEREIVDNYLVLAVLFVDIVFMLLLLKKILKEIKSLKDL